MSKPSKLNAIKHGLFFEMVILPGEEPAEFQALYSALRKEYNPEGPTQEDRVLSIAKNLWRKRRLSRYGGNHVRLYKSYMQGQERLEIEALQKFADSVRAGKPRSKLTLPAPLAAIVWTNNPQKLNESDDEWRQRLAGVADELREALINQPGELAQTAVETLFCVESLDAELAREERIDAKIDKDIVALGRMKTMQAMGLGRRSDVYAQEYESTKHLDSPEGSPDKVDKYQ
jgi:hypothetical protein